VQSRLFNYARELFATAQLDWTTGVYRAMFLPESFVPDFDAQFLSDISAGVRIAISEEINGRTATDGVCSGTHAKFPFLFDSRFITQALIFKDSGIENTSVLVAYLGEEDLVTQRFKPLGLDYFIYPNVEGGGFFRL
jgi:hypothetical protein